MGNSGDWPVEEPTRRLPNRKDDRNINETSPTEKTWVDSHPDHYKKDSRAADLGATRYLDYRQDSQGTEFLPDRSFDQALPADSQRQQMDPLSRGIRSFANYFLDKKLSDGGMSWVYLAHKEFEEFEDKKAILKVVQPRVSAELFRSEVNTLIALGDHPHIISFLDGGTLRGIDQKGYKLQYQWMAMPRADGGSLKKRLQEYKDHNKHLPLNEVVRILDSTAAAVDFAHEQGRIHRDIKPGNILFGQHDEVLLSDFGITVDVTESGRKTGKGGAGTPPYMAPEQWKREEVDARTDTYGLGAMLFEMVTNEVPYPAEDVRSLSYQVINEPVPSARKRYKKVPSAVDKVLQKALAKDPDNRYQTASELADAFSAAVGRNRKIGLIILFVFLAIIFSGGIIFALTNDPDDQLQADATAAAVEAIATLNAGATNEAIARKTAAAQEIELANQQATSTVEVANATVVADVTASAVIEITRIAQESIDATATEAWILTATWESLPRPTPGNYTFPDKEATVEKSSDYEGSWACTITYIVRLTAVEVMPNGELNFQFEREASAEYDQTRFNKNPCVMKVFGAAGQQKMFLVHEAITENGYEEVRTFYHVTGGFMEEDTQIEEGEVYKGNLIFPPPTPGSNNFKFVASDEDFEIDNIVLGGN